MRKHQIAVMDAIYAEWPTASIGVHHGRHLRLTITVDGLTVMATVSLSPRSGVEQIPKNTVKQVRRALMKARASAQP